MADPEKAMEVENDHEDIEDEEVEGEGGTSMSELLKNPALVQALHGKLNSMVGMNSGYIAVINFKIFFRKIRKISKNSEFSLNFSLILNSIFSKFEVFQ